MNAGCTIRRTTWAEDSDALRHVRHQVFIIEQRIAPDEEWDAADAICRHVLAVDAAAAPIGTGRLLPDGHIGRMAVLAAWRRQGVAGALLNELMKWAREDGHRIVRLHAQSYAVPFYERHGFSLEGEEFLEVGIPHRYMRRGL